MPIVIQRVSPRREERARLIMETARHFHNLRKINLNKVSYATAVFIIDFETNVVKGAQGNHAALNRSINALPRVRNILRKQPAATTIQAHWRGMRNRQRANTRRRALGTLQVIGPNGSISVAVPSLRRR